MKTFILCLILTFNLISCADKIIKTPEKEHSLKIFVVNESVMLPDNFEIVDIDRQDSHLFWLTLLNKKTNVVLSCSYVTATRFITTNELNCDVMFHH